jgi:hypothetical protein
LYCTRIGSAANTFDTYESRTMSWFGPAMGDYFGALIREMIEFFLK